MKKLLALISALILCSNMLSAQEALQHLGASIEVGTTGAGVNVSFPVITDRLIVTVGYNFPSVTINSHFDLNASTINSKINAANNMIGNYNKVIDENPEGAQKLGMTKITPINEVDKINTEVKAKLNFGNFKLMAEFYPSKSNYFHFTAGLLIGSGEWIDINAQVDEKVWNTYITAMVQNEHIPTLSKNDPKVIEAGIKLNTDIHPVAGLEDAAKLNIHDETYHLSKDCGGHLNTKLMVNKVKPYIGIGFGSSIPTKRRLGFQTELGAYYQGKPYFESSAKTEYDKSAFSSSMVDDIIDNIIYLHWYPQLTFRLTGRIF